MYHKHMNINHILSVILNDLQSKYDQLQDECNQMKSDWRRWDAMDIVISWSEI